jgi:hypothetical protein
MHVPRLIFSIFSEKARSPLSPTFYSAEQLASDWLGGGLGHSQKLLLMVSAEKGNQRIQDWLLSKYRNFLLTTMTLSGSS